MFNVIFLKNCVKVLYLMKIIEMMNYSFLLIGIICLLLSICLLFTNKFYKRKEHDMLWATSSNFFGSSIVLAIFAIIILINEFRKLF